MKSLVIVALVLLFTVPCYGQWGDWSKPYEIEGSSQSLGTLNGSRFDSDSLRNKYGAGSKFKVDGLRNPYSRFGSPYSNQSWTNPHATQPPTIYGRDGTYYGRLSANRFDPDSTSNQFGRYGSRYSPDSIRNPYGAGSRYTQPLYVYPGR